MTDNMKSTQGAMLLPLYLCAMVCLLARIQIGAANVVLMGKNNLTLSFDDVEANIVPGVKGSGVKGVVYTAEPLNACSPLTNKVVKGPPSPFALVIGGGCTFDEKVKNVHDAGFKAAIVYDHENSTGVPVSKVGTITVAGRASGIHIYAVFISKVSGEVLKKFSGSTDVEVWIIPIFENSARLFMAISFISLVAMTAVLVTCFFVRRHRVRRDRLRNEEAQEFHGMSSQFVKAIPSLVFTEAQEDNCTSSMCAICLEDYNVGEKLRVLPCRHKFHAACVDMWLMSWRSFCPVCKGDAGAGIISGPSASETTPLFSSAVGLPYGSAGASPPSRPISRRPSSQSISRIYSVSGTPHSYTSMNGSLADLANMFSPCLGTLHLGSTRSPPVNISYAPSHMYSHSGYGSSSPHLSSSYISNSGYRSSGHYHYLSSSSQHHRSSSYLRRCGESGPNLSTMATQSPQQSQLLCHGGDSETSLNHLAAGASSAQSYLRHCGDSDASLSAMASSGQSLSPFSAACMQEMA